MKKPDKKRYVNFNHMNDLMAFNREQGLHFFSQTTTKFFGSQIETVSKPYGGCVFITSEKDNNRPRLYTVRAMRENGRIETIGGFQRYKNLDEAIIQASMNAITITEER